MSRLKSPQEEAFQPQFQNYCPWGNRFRHVNILIWLLEPRPVHVHVREQQRQQRSQQRQQQRPQRPQRRQQNR